MKKPLFSQDPQEMMILKELSSQAFSFVEFYKKYGKEMLLKAMDISNRSEKFKNARKIRS